MTLRQTSLWMCLVTFVLLTKHMSHSVTVAGVSVDPPENIKIIDPGHLGYLNIQWSPPGSLHDLVNCTVRYQLRFYDTYTGRWKGVQTSRLFYAAQFNLEKPIQVRMLTLLKGSCTNGSDILGEDVEFVHMPEHKGVADSRIRDFHCVYFNKEYMECTWEPGTVEPVNSKHYLYYWHRAMQETQECPAYVTSGERRKGCRFPPTSLLDFSEFNICVNGSSEAGDLEPAFFSLAVQNHVKPAAVSNLHLVHNGTLVHVEWAPPSGPIPEQCLEYEVEITTGNHNDSEKQTAVIDETAFDLHQDGVSDRKCFRVRSKVNIYCADDGFWSNWSQPRCIPETEPRSIVCMAPWSALLLLTIIASVIVLVGTVCLILWMLKKMWKNRNEQKHVFRALYQEKVQKVIPPIFSPML
ncbi:interleukin-13 receptor subunit alpha-2 [Ictalurus punctatus]|uniref:Interleukin-13 receptor subunit alpha-2 n=1 Tax=Ictalurus punctatus TaxID=7998 RepID=W5U7Y9_ICTPU|nr:interleukin-13 receptor subunit alpha-2 [Ictalurus punctatus]XP_017316146.1 interleukin-13 receptor subunit alpha-2 [Ictalurus punctatus]